MAALYRIFKDKWIAPAKETTESFRGKNIIVTGATAGIGLEAASRFAALDANKVIIAARDLQKGENIKANIEARVNRKDQLEVWQLDMNSYDSIVAFAKRAETLDHLDIAILNAGLRRTPFVKSDYGWEDDLQVNCISTILLGILLLPTLKRSKSTSGGIPVLEFTNSGLHATCAIRAEAVEADSILQAYNTPEAFAPQDQYASSKLLLMFATNKLAEVVSSGDVIVTSVCPGVVMTDLAREVKFPGVKIMLAIIGAVFFQTPAAGSRMLVSGTKQGERAHGRFWKGDQIQPIAPTISGDANKKVELRVWNEIIETLSKDVPVVQEIPKGTAKS